MIGLGSILIILGLLFSSILFWIGVAVFLIGVFLNFGGPVGPTGVRRRYY